MYTLFMRNKVSSIVAFVSILLYAAVIGIGAVRILAIVQERRVAAQREFYDLADTASSAGALGFMGDAFKDAVRDAVDASKTLQAVIVTGPFGAEFTYERDNNGLIAIEGDTPRFQRRFGVSRNPHFSPLRVDGLRNATIQAVSGAVDYPAVSLILLQSMFMVLAAALLSVVTLAIFHMRGKKTALVSDTMQKISRKKQGRAAAAMDPGPEKTAKNDAGAFIKERLDAELGICALADKDLSLLLIKTSPAAGSGVSRKLVEQAGEFFTPSGSVHERGAGSLAVILSGEGLEESFSMARQFHSLIAADFPELPMNGLRIGISSRSKRLVRAARLLLEASKALDKTGLDSPIVAFKSDPEKYKAFVQDRKRAAARKANTENTAGAVSK
jgi:hypothetical protein